MDFPYHKIGKKKITELSYDVENLGEPVVIGENLCTMMTPSLLLFQYVHYVVLVSHWNQIKAIMYVVSKIA